MPSVIRVFLIISWCSLGWSHQAPAAEPRHEVVPGWPSLPDGCVLGLCAGVGVDSHNHVFVFHRCGRKWSTPFPTETIAAPTVTVFDGQTGRLLASWGAGQFIMP